MSGEPPASAPDPQPLSRWWVVGGIALGVVLGVLVVCILVFTVGAGIDSPGGA